MPDLEADCKQHQSKSRFSNSSSLWGNEVKMSRRCFWSSVINNTITKAIDNFERDCNRSKMRTGVMAGWKGNKLT